MKWLLRWVTESFIATFGITRPRLGEEERAGLYIVGLLVALLIVLALVTYVLLRMW